MTLDDMEPLCTAPQSAADWHWHTLTIRFAADRPLTSHDIVSNRDPAFVFADAFREVFGDRALMLDDAVMIADQV